MTSFWSKMTAFAKFQLVWPIFCYLHHHSRLYQLLKLFKILCKHSQRFASPSIWLYFENHKELKYKKRFIYVLTTNIQENKIHNYTLFIKKNVKYKTTQEKLFLVKFVQIKAKIDNSENEAKCWTTLKSKVSVVYQKRVYIMTTLHNSLYHIMHNSKT